MGKGVQLGSLGTAATNRPIVTTPGDYDDGELGGMMIGKGNRSTRQRLIRLLLKSIGFQVHLRYCKVMWNVRDTQVILT
jgi:hypothetical protein